MSKLSNELTNDPLVRGYSGMTDQEVADSLNTVNRSARGGISGMLEYLLNNKNRTNAGADLSATAILGRLHHVSDSTVGDDPFGSGIVVTLQMKHAAQSFLDLLFSYHLTSMDFEGANLPYAKCVDAGVWKSGDVTALKALSQNQVSRASELGIKKVNEGDVKHARAA